ncbi:MAG: hypothetical protein AAFV95_24685 [Bacteroidota bacterium]
MNRYIYNILVIRYYVEFDYERVIQSCDEAIQTIPKHYPRKADFQFAFLEKKIPALLALGRHEEAKEIARQAGQLVSPGQFNWQLILIQRIEVCFHAGHLQEAYDLYKAHTQYLSNFQALNEYWNILRAYLFFFIRAGKIKPYVEERFRLGKFLNELPMYSRDKAGVNINILLVQILIEMSRGQYGRIIDRVEALGAYARKYLKRPETIRAYLFIKMIIQMNSAKFHRTATERKTQRLHEQLSNAPLSVGKSITVEMVPYEVLWQEILCMLDNKFRGVKVGRRLERK